METTGERLDFYRQEKGHTLKDLAETLGLTEGAIRNAIKRNNIKPSHINVLCETYNISKEWILNGTGDMEGFKKENSQQNEESFLQKHYDKILMQKDQFLDSVLKDNERLRKELDLMRSNNNKN